MKPWVTIGTAGPLVLQQRDDEFVIRSRGIELMSSRRHASEDAMAEYAVGKNRVLIGGLGLGFTLRAVLAKNVPNVMIAELEPAVVEWNRGPLGNAALLSDPRVHLHVGDVATADGRFDAILLDVDNGPSALSDETNSKLYGPAGLSRLHQMLKARGTLVVWSAGPDFHFVKRLGRAGFTVEQREVKGGVLFVGQRRR